MKWLLFETEDLVVIMPEKDKKPHGKKLTESRYDINTMVCECNPTIMVGEVNETIQGFLLEVPYDKPIITHKRFKATKE